MLILYQMSERPVNHRLRRVAMSKAHDAKSLSELSMSKQLLCCFTILLLKDL